MSSGPGRVGLPEVRLGMIPAFGGTQRLTQLVGKAKALELMFKGLQLAREDALRAGLITGVLPPEELYDHSPATHRGSRVRPPARLRASRAP